MDDYIWQFTWWIYENYGRTGCAVCFVIMVSVLTLSFILLNRLPESKTVTIEKY